VTIQKTEIEQSKAEMTKVARAMVRLKHTLAADRELNEVLPRIEKEFDKRVQRGELPGAVDLEEIIQKELG